MRASSDQVVQFDAFTLDTQHRVLLCKGDTVPLSPKQFELLHFFVRNPGRVLTKEEILEAVWQNQFVEEGSLTQTVFWLRKALARGTSDSDDARRNILTIPGKGYQFNFLESQPSTAASSEPFPASSAVASAPHSTPFPRRRIVWSAITATAVAGAVGLSVARHYITHRALADAASTQPQEIILGEFADTTSDPSLKSALGIALRIGLEQSRRLNVTPASEIEETLHYMKLPEAAPLTPELAQQVCQRRGAQAIVLGSVSSVGNQFIVSVEARDCARGKALSANQATVQQKEQIVAALDGILPQLRTSLGESSASIQQFNTSIEQATTPSLEAFKAYVAGDELRQQGDSIQAIPLYQHAIALDPNFAMAHARLGSCYATLSERSLAAAAYTRAYQLSGSVSQPEKFYIQSLYTHRVERNMVDTIRIHNEWRTLYPQDSHSWVSETDALTQMGRLDDAIQIGEKGYRQFPHDGMMAMAMARAYQRTGRFDDLRRVAADAAGKGIESWDIHEMLWYRASVLGDQAVAQSELNWIKGKPEEYQALDDVANFQLEQGQWRESLATWARFEDAAKQQSMTGYADIDVGLYSTALVEFGLREQAVAVLKRWPAVNPTPEYARGLAAIGAEAQAKAAMDTLIRSHPKDTLLVLWHKPILEATIALNHPGDAAAARALASLEPAKGVGMRDYAVGYLRGKAYLRLGHYLAAVAEFKSITDAPGLDPSSPLRSMALLQLANAQSHVTGDRESSSTYRRTLAEWRHADPDLPALSTIQTGMEGTPRTQGSPAN